MSDLKFKFNFELYEYLISISYGEFTAMGDGAVKKVSSVEDIIEFEKKQRYVVNCVYKLPANDSNAALNVYYCKVLERYNLDDYLIIPLIEFKKRFLKNE
jgi:hypothetical protein